MSFKRVFGSPDVTPDLAFISSEFLLWLWWVSDVNGSVVRFANADPGQEEDYVEIWIDDRITMRALDETKISNVMTGETIATAPEAKVAVANGKVIHEMRFGLRFGDREYFFGLKGSELALNGAKLPTVISDSSEEAILDRMHLLDELETLIFKIFSEFADTRVSEDWRQTAAEIDRWLAGEL